MMLKDNSPCLNKSQNGHNLWVSKEKIHKPLMQYCPENLPYYMVTHLFYSPFDKNFNQNNGTKFDLIYFSK